MAEGAGRTARVAGGRRTWFDVLSLVACLAVVVLHCTLTVFGSARDAHWRLALVLQGIFIFAVPVFFMMSGANLMRYRERYGTREFFRRRLRKVGVGMLAASVVCYLLYCLFPDAFYGGEGYAASAGVGDFLWRLATNQVNDTYWFLYTLAYLYLLTPLLSLAAERCGLLRAYAALSFVAAFVLPLAVWAGWLPQEVSSTLFGWPMLASTATFYYVAGHCLVRWPPSRRRRVAWEVAGLVSLVLMGWLAWRTNRQSEAYDATLISASSAFGAVYALGVFQLFQGLAGRLASLPGRVRDVLARLSGATFFVYLFHVPVINWVGATLEDTDVPAFNLDHPLLEALAVFAVTMALGLVWQAAKRAARKAVTQRG